MRKLATIRKIDEINPIPDADAIEVATIGGWKVVVKKNEFMVGDLVCYFEIDSFIPHALAPFLSKGKEPREFEGVKGERLRTVRLRGQISQGLILPLGTVMNFHEDLERAKEDGMLTIKYLCNGILKSVPSEGYDMTEDIGIKKWEAPIPAQLAGQIKGNFPSRIPKTDQERVQNLKKEISNAAQKSFVFEATEKLEGSSMTCYLIDGEFGVCSRNLDLKKDENNTLWAVAIKERIEEKMRSIGDNFALQGEIIGPGIQKNIYGLNSHEFHIFDVYDIANGEYLSPNDRFEAVEVLGLKHVPILTINFHPGSIDEILEFAEGKSQLNPKQEREGVVFKQMYGDFTFKAISNRYLLKNND